MAYNNGFPMNYNQMYPQIPIMPQMPQSQPNDSLIWVQGETGAKSYLIAPNKTVPLWDSEAQTIYLKSADASGMPSMKVLDYTIRESTNTPLRDPINKKEEEYVTKEELEAFRAEISKKIEGFKEDMGA